MCKDLLSLLQTKMTPRIKCFGTGYVILERMVYVPPARSMTPDTGEIQPEYCRSPTTPFIASCMLRAPHQRTRKA
jgi:hypothetical protein